jgi:hypothetical protein
MTVNPDDNLLIPGPNAVLEVSAKGSAADVRSWMRDKIGQEGARLFVNSIAEPGIVDTILNLRRGSVGIGTEPFEHLKHSKADRDRSKLHVVGQSVLEGDVVVVGDFGVTGMKFFVMPHPADPTMEVAYAAAESGEAGTYVRGSATLTEGEAVITLPEHFGLTTGPSGLTCQLTPREAWLHLFVSELTTGGLVVHEAAQRSGRFDYLVQGTRIGYEDFAPIRKTHALRLNGVS